jgi:hypothetical protein
MIGARMSFTVWGAFDSFRTDAVDLPPAQTRTGRASRDYLFEQIKKLPAKYPWFPRMIGTYVPYGSFARSVKIRRLDDIDALVLLVGTGTEISRGSNDQYTIWLRILNSSAPLAMYPDDHGFVNSTKVLNAMKAALADVPAYGKADIKRNGEAVSLSLSSYPWTFDVVPAVPVESAQGGYAYYLIPDGSGDWKATDPRRDGARATAANQRHSGELLPVIRLLKYWNRRVHKPRLPSYYFENLVIDAFQTADPITTYPNAVSDFFATCSTSIWLTCPDPKGLGPPLDHDIPVGTTLKVSEAMKEAAQFASYATMYETLGRPADAMYWWRRVFGPDFPGYG